MRKLRLLVVPAVLTAAEWLGTASASGYFRTK
jgi:hypothetical protein